MLVLRERSDHGRLLGRIERQDPALVPEQHHRAAGSVARGRDSVGQQHLRFGFVGLDRCVGVLEQAGAELDAQDPAHCVVDPLHRDPVLVEQLLAEVADQGARHLGVDAGVEREGCRAGSVGGDAVTAFTGVGCLRRTGAHLGDRRPVALDEPVELPLVFEDLVHRVVVAAAGHAVDRVERAHRRVRTGVDSRLERRQIEIPEPLFRQVGGVVVPAALRLAVRGEVLGARDELVGCAVVAALNRLDASGREHRVQVGVLSGGLGDPAPARFVRDVHHRGIGLLEPHDGRLARAVRVVVGGHLRIEARACGQRDRKDRPEAVDRVEGEEQRDLQARLLDGHLLQFSNPLWIGDAQDRPESIAHLGVGDQEVRQELDLLELLLERHLREQVAHSRLDFLVRRLPCGLKRLLVTRLRRGDDACGCGCAEREDRDDERSPKPQLRHGVPFPSTD